MRAHFFILVAVCSVATQASPLSVEKPLESGMNLISVPEEIDALLRITEQDLSIYLTMLTENLADFGLLLTARVLGAYNESQSAGQCALSIERLTNKKLYEAGTSVKSSILANAALVENALAKANTTEQVNAAIVMFSNYKQINAARWAQFVAQMSEIYADGVNKIIQCIK